MSESVSLPALGESVTEGTVTRWLKQVGDHVDVDEPLLEVSTDKVDTEIPSPVAGVIEEILVGEDETVEVGTALVRIGDGSGGGDAGSGDDAASADAGQEPPAAQPAEPQPDAPTAPAQASPAEQEQPSAESVPAPAAEPEQPAASGEVETSSTNAPAPGEQSDERPPAPAESVDEPSGEQEQAPQGGSTPEPQSTPQQSDSGSDAPAPTPSASEAPSGPVTPPGAQSAPVPASSSGAASGGEPPTPPQGASGNAGYVTPLVRKLAHERGVDLAGISGTGVGGRIRKQDVLDAADTAASATPDAGQPAAAQQARAARATVLEDSPLRGTTVPMSRLRKVVAERAVVSMQSTAQLTSVVEVDVTRVAALRDRVKGEFQQKTGQKLSFLPFFAMAAVEALRAYPIINSTVDGDSIVYPPSENLSIAVDTERGLLTPVIKDASSHDIAGLAAQIADLAGRTRDNKLKPDELAGGTFTLTNTGSRGALFDTPVVFLPQSAILGTGIVVKRPAVVKVDGADAFAVRSMVYLALSYDHRIIDGADAARFLTAVKNRLEEAAFEDRLGI